MPLVKGGGSNGSRHCGRNSSRLCSYIRAFCASFSFFLAIIQVSWRFACLSRSMLRRCIFVMWVEKEKKRMTVRHIKLKGIDIFIESFLEIIEIVESSSSISKWTDVKQGNELS